jgi:protein-disulfide isomerase
MHLPRYPLAVAILVTTACRADTGALEHKLEKMETRLDRLEKARPAAQQARARRPEPDPKTVFAVNVDGNAFDGPADAPVTIVEGYEYACPACNNARSVVAQLKAQYGDKIRVVYKQYIVHPEVATNAAYAICAANKQGKFAAMDRVLWEKGYGGGRDFSPAKIDAFAREADVDITKFNADVAGRCREEVARQHGELATMGQGATPTFFVNGRYAVGASPVKLAALIDEELALAQQRIAAGTAPASYYQTWVVAKGAKKFEPPPAS